MRQLLLLIALSICLFSSIADAADPYTITSKGPVVGGSIISEIAEKAGPAVVNIDWQRKVKRKAIDPFENFFDKHFFGFDNPFEHFYTEREVPISGAGSGVIIDNKKGYVITNEHVIHDANPDKINITLKNGDKLEGKVIGKDKKLDIAVIRIKKKYLKKKLPQVKLGNSDKSKVGEWVVAIGNPYRFSNTITVGIISALGRNLEAIHKTNLIQTDAAINPGNSGGPLINMKGEVIGINVAIDARAEGIGFAIPINQVKNILQELIAKGKIIRPWLGVYMKDVNEEIAKYLDLPIAQGVIIINIVKGSPAAKAKLEKYDIIKSMAGIKLKNAKHLQEILARKKPKQWLKLVVWRNGKNINRRIKIGEAP